ncbi:MAG TPA: sensor histidine kinase [Micromonosporaceae bacterium]|nr:sensor histidine kinase [Micromonosporaceae bacterium]
MAPRPLHWLRGRPLAADSLLAAALVVLEIVVIAALPTTPGGLAQAAGLSLLCALPVALRRIAPRTAVVAALATLALTLAVGEYSPTQALTFVVLTYSVAAACPLPPAALATAILWIPVMAVNTLGPGSEVAPELGPIVLIINNLLVALVTFFFGRTVHGHRAANQALQERARAAEENQRTLAEQAVAAERQRIARELHDVVAHHVVVMGVLATGARRMLRRDPDAVDEALGTIEDTSRTTVREMRRLLDVLRTDAEPTAADLTPQPGLAGIETLVEQVREAGLPVTLDVDGELAALEPGVGLTVFRIVQEALTNTLKHAGPTTAHVRLNFGAYWLTVEILDDGRGPAPQPGRIGHGLVGMHERVALYGGTLHTGPRPGGGFRVYAKIPREQLGASGEEAA